MSMAETILARCPGRLNLEPGEDVWVNVDVGKSLDICGPGTICIFRREFEENAKMEGRVTSCNVDIEEGGKNGVVPADEISLNYLEDKTSVEFGPVYSNKDARLKGYGFGASELEHLGVKGKVEVPTFLVQVTYKIWMDIDIASKSQYLVERHVPRSLRKVVVILLPFPVMMFSWVVLETLTLTIVNLRYLSLSQTGIFLAGWATKKRRSTWPHLT